ncbi:juvenile hormone binding protein 1 [Arctopsyche grandis]|uniref:juvenile hormone binding protein 1 n=1 Tax=Arctopsyche grandis TaxID=121162 RepID=UPI00406D8FBB
MFANALIFVTGLMVSFTVAQEVPPYIKQCRSSDPKLLDCFTGAIHHLRPWLARGIPEIEMPTIEPFTMEELVLSLSTGPTGYKIALRNLDVFGASNYTISKLKLSENGRPFEARIKMPALKINAKYTSSGVLFILPASGNGTFNAIFDGVTADIRGKVNSNQKQGGRYLHVDSLEVDLHVKNVKMSVKRIFNNNRILIEAINLFLRENGQEVLKAMMPQLRLQLSKVFRRIANQLLKNVPVHLFYIEE